MRMISCFAVTSLILTGAAPAAGPAPAAFAVQASALSRSAADPESICAPFMQLDEINQFGNARGRLMASPRSPGSPPPPPPPPPPSPPPPPPMVSPPPVSTQTNETIVTTGSRIAAPMLTSPSAMAAIGAGNAENRERYAGKEVARVQAVAEAPVSTFGIDVDTGSYANVRRMLTGGQMPPQAAVRTEEMLNYFRYDYPAPRERGRPFTISTDMTTTPWNGETRLLRVGLRGYDLPRSERPPANLVFLVDVSGSMMSMDKLPLVKCSLALLANQMSRRDRISIVVYAGAAGRVLAPTSDRGRVIDALSRLQAGGSTAGAQGLALAYQTARESRIEGGINRVILATDGDFNVGVSNNEALVDMVERERESGITLTTLGYGTGNYNEAMMEQIADHGNGNYAYIDSAREAQKVLEQELASTLFTIAQDVKIQVEFNPAYVSEYRLIGYENRTLAEEDFDNDAVDAGDIGAGHQVTALYEIVPAGSRGWMPDRRYPANRRDAAGAANGELAWLRLRYKLPGRDQSLLIERPVAASMVRGASAPRGDTAFIAAVAGFGQKLRGDPYLNGFGFADARRLASAGGTGGDYWRREFLRLTELAESGGGSGR